MLLLLLLPQPSAATIDGAVIFAAARRKKTWIKSVRQTTFRSIRKTLFIVKGISSMVSYASMQVGEVIKFGIQFEELQAIASSDVTATGIAISQKASSGNTLSAVLTPSTAGKFTVQYQATASDGQRFIQNLIVTVS